MKAFQLFIICVYIFVFKLPAATPDTVWHQHEVPDAASVKEYMVSTSQADFYTARNRCKEEEGDLAVLNNDAIFRFITNQSQFSQGAMANRSYYVGAMQVDGEMDGTTRYEWLDIDRSRLVGRWGPNQPNATYKCVVLRIRMGSIYSWYTETCRSGEFNFICQREAGSYWSAWGDWTDCSTACRGANITRERMCQVTRKEGPNFCGTQKNIQMNGTCNSNRCTIVKNTTTCNATCGQSGYFEEFFVCQNGEKLPESCSDRKRFNCSGQCFLSEQSEQTVSSSSAPAIPSSTLTNPAITPRIQEFPLGAAVGGGIAGVVFFLVLILLLVVWRRRTMKPKTYEREAPVRDCNADTLREHVNGNQQNNEEEMSPFNTLPPNVPFTRNPNTVDGASEYDSLQHQQETNGGQGNVTSRPDSYSIVRKSGAKPRDEDSTNSVYNVLKTDSNRAEDNYNALTTTAQASSKPVPSTSLDYDHTMSNRFSNSQSNDVSVLDDVKSDYNSLSFNHTFGKEPRKDVYEVVEERFPTNDEAASSDHPYEQVDPFLEVTISTNDYNVFTTR